MITEIENVIKAIEEYEENLYEQTPGSRPYMDILEGLQASIGEYRGLVNKYGVGGYDSLYDGSRFEELDRNVTLAWELRISVEDAEWRRKKTWA
jgi:hypothetical protein